MNKYSATELLKRRKEIPKGDCRTCKHFYKEDDCEVCLKVDKFILPEFRPYNCKDWSEKDE